MSVWSDITTWVGEKAAGLKILGADFNKLNGQVQQIYGNTEWLKDNSLNQSGWFDAGETWAYASADAPTFTFTVPDDKTGKYSAGMKIKLTQTTVKYFIITAVSYSSGTGLTTITVYGGTDYTMANTSITSPCFSIYRAPYGFPVNPDKWSVLVTDTTMRQQSSPSAGTWYNLGSLSITIPAGEWEVTVDFTHQANISNNNCNIISTLSTSVSAETNSDFTNYSEGFNIISDSCFSKSHLLLTAKTIYYLISKSSGSPSVIYIRSDVNKTIIRAVCAYL